LMPSTGVGWEYPITFALKLELRDIPRNCTAFGRYWGGQHD
jgi:hypothetical protein